MSITIAVTTPLPRVTKRNGEHMRWDGIVRPYRDEDVARLAAR